MDNGGKHSAAQTNVNGGAVYGLGLIGALVWYWRQAGGPKSRALGVLKAIVWPAFLVYDAHELLHRSD